MFFRKTIRGALIVVSALLICSCHPQGMDEPTKIIHLYPEGQEVDRGIVEDGVQVTLGPLCSNQIDTTEFYWEDDGSWNNVQDARILLYLPRHHNGQMVVMCPGGGYGELTARGEGYFAAKELTRMGHPVCVVFYRLPNGHSEIPLRDVQNAFRYCRYHAAEWGVTQIGIMGGSAGGHLAACASTIYEDEITRPDFTVLLYAVTSIKGEYAHKAVAKRMTAEGTMPELLDRFNPVGNVSADTPPACIFNTSDDRGVKPEQAILYYEALRHSGVRAELYILPHGRHGWAFNHGGFTVPEDRDRLGPLYRDAYLDLMEAFLTDMRQIDTNSSGRTR